MEDRVALPLIRDGIVWHALSSRNVTMCSLYNSVKLRIACTHVSHRSRVSRHKKNSTSQHAAHVSVLSTLFPRPRGPQSKIHVFTFTVPRFSGLSMSWRYCLDGRFCIPLSTWWKHFGQFLADYTIRIPIFVETKPVTELKRKIRRIVERKVTASSI